MTWKNVEKDKPKVAKKHLPKTETKALREPEAKPLPEIRALKKPEVKAAPTEYKPIRELRPSTVCKEWLKHFEITDADAAANKVRRALRGTTLTQNQFDALVLDCSTGAMEKVLNGHLIKQAGETLLEETTKATKDDLKKKRKVQWELWQGLEPTK